MRLKDKQTEEVGDYTIVNRVGKHCVGVAKDGDIDNPIFFDSMAELNERFEDAPEEKKYGGRVPKEGDCYRFIDWNGCIRSFLWEDPDEDGPSFESGNAFWTEEEAKKELARRRAYVILKEDTKGFKPDWENEDEEKWYVIYHHNTGKFSFEWHGLFSCGEKLYFATIEDAEASIKVHEKEWKTWLGVEE